MFRALQAALFALALVCITVSPIEPVTACCPAGPTGKPVMNADQTVILIWDAATKTQHFIRKASFRSQAEDFGFLVPSPSQPELDESGDTAFGTLYKLTEPEIEKVRRSSGGGCSIGCAEEKKSQGKDKGDLKVLQEKIVAGFKASVLETKSTTALIDWLKANGYAFSPSVEAWARPYVDQGWKITALKVAPTENGDSREKTKSVAAPALRMSFKTDRPLFPYREPAPDDTTKAMAKERRLLRIYFVAEARYRGELTTSNPWTGEVAWSNKVPEEIRKKTLQELKLPEKSGPAEWWLTEFEDPWVTRSAPADVYFSKDPRQETVKRPPITQYVRAATPDIMFCLLLMAIVLPPLSRRLWRE